MEGLGPRIERELKREERVKKQKWTYRSYQ